MAGGQYRVKLYELTPEYQWDDRGCGYLQCARGNDETSAGVRLVVHSESDNNVRLLESDVRDEVHVHGCTRPCVCVCRVYVSVPVQWSGSCLSAVYARRWCLQMSIVHIYRAFGDATLLCGCVYIRRCGGVQVHICAYVGASVYVWVVCVCVYMYVY